MSFHPTRCNQRGQLGGGGCQNRCQVRQAGYPDQQCRNFSQIAGLVGSTYSASYNASKQASAMGAAYSSSKFAVLGLTQASALDLAPYLITVNAVCPGPINTDRMSYWERSQAQERGISQEEFRAQIVQRASQTTPLGRTAEAEDVANMVAFLSSDDASFVTGQAYNVNGGLLFH